MAGRILIADSLSSNRALVQAQLDPAGYRMRRAGSRDEALARAQDHRPDLVVIHQRRDGTRETLSLIDDVKIAHRAAGHT